MAVSSPRRPFRSAGFAFNVHGANNQIDDVRDKCVKKKAGKEKERGWSGMLVGGGALNRDLSKKRGSQVIVEGRTLQERDEQAQKP